MMIKKIILWVAIILTQAACCYNLPNEHNSIKLPLTFDAYSIPHVELEINGQTAYFMLDTGSKNGLHLTREWMAHMGEQLQLLAEKEQSTDLTGRLIENDQFIVKQIMINGMSFENITGVELQPWGLYVGQDSDNAPDNAFIQDGMVIGLGLFTDKQILIDYSQKSLTVALPNVNLRRDDSLWIEIPWAMTAEGLALSFSQENTHHNYTLVLDTGASISLVSSQRSPTLQYSSCKEAGLELEMDSMPCRVAFLHLTNFPQIPPLMALVLDMDFGSFEQNGLVGFNFFQMHRVLIDLSTERVWISSVSSI